MIIGQETTNMLFIKRIFYKYRRKKFLSLESNVESKLRYLLDNYDSSYEIDFSKVDKHNYKTYSTNVEELILSMIQMNKDLERGTNIKATRITQKKEIKGSSYFTDDTPVGLRFNKEDTASHFNRELKTYISQLNKHKDDPIEIQFFARRHGQQLEDIMELLKHNL